MQSVYARLESLQKIGIKLGLKNIRLLLRELDEPHLRFPSVLIAGTNGKGSVSAMLDQILTEHGYRTGHYTSPHLVHVRERIRVARQMITEGEFTGALTKVFAAIDELQSRERLTGVPTYFEVLTAAAFLFFHQASVDFAIVEVGLGGRFDATNALEQKISVITTIDFDHEQHLGKSLSKIANEKAGILKERNAVVTGILPKEARTIISNRARELHCSLRSLEARQIQNLRLDSEGLPLFHFSPWECEIRVNLRGKHQAKNAAVALLACDAILDHSGVALNRQIAVDALLHVQWPGRLHLLRRNPDTYLDCAHNVQGAQALAQFLNDLNIAAAVFVFTAMKDKNVEGMLRTIASRATSLILTQVEPLERCASKEQLSQAANEAGINFQWRERPEEALDLATGIAKKTSVPVVAFGSIYLIGHILKHC